MPYSSFSVLLYITYFTSNFYCQEDSLNLQSITKVYKELSHANSIRTPLSIEGVHAPTTRLALHLNQEEYSPSSKHHQNNNTIIFRRTKLKNFGENALDEATPSFINNANSTMRDLSTALGGILSGIKEISFNRVFDQNSTDATSETANYDDGFHNLTIDVLSTNTEVEINVLEFSSFNSYELMFSSPNDRVPSQNPIHVTINPFVLKRLRPGHEYLLNFITKDRDGLTFQAHKRIVTNPDPINIDLHLTTISTDFIDLVAKKTNLSLQDYFSVDYFQLDPLKRTFDTLNINDNDRHNSIINTRIDGLSPGRAYNVTIKAHRKNRTSPARTVIVVTKPLPPLDLTMLSNISDDQISLHWETPKSGVDHYLVELKTLDDEIIFQRNTTENTLHINTSVDQRFIPGKQFDVSLATIKGPSWSDYVAKRITIRPMPPLNATVRIDYEELRFALVAELHLNSIQDHCTLHYEDDNGNAHDSKSDLLSNSLQCQWTELGLQPGKHYSLHIRTVSGNTSSSEIIWGDVVHPAFNFRLFHLLITPTETGFQLHAEPSKMRHYWSSLVGQSGLLDISVSEYPFSTATFNPLIDANATLTGLTSGKCYATRICSVVNGVVSRDAYDDHRRTLLPPLSVHQVSVTAHSVQLFIVWSSLDNDRPTSVDPSCYLNIVSLSQRTSRPISHDFALTSRSSTITFPPDDSLHPHSNYVLNLKISCGNSTEMCAVTMRQLDDIKFDTLESAPGPVSWLIAKSLSSTVAEIEWRPPAIPNGIITGYNVIVEDTQSFDKFSVSTNANTTRTLLRNLTGGLEYSVNVRARTSAGPGESYCDRHFENNSCGAFKFKTMITAPPKPADKIEVVTNTVQTTMFTITYNYKMFSTKHGLPSRYAVIVAEGDSPVDPPSDMTWADVQRLNLPWPPYVAIEKRLPNQKVFSSTPTYDVIGLNRPECSKDQSEEDIFSLPVDEHLTSRSPNHKQTIWDRICNGPLKPGTKYRVKIRLYTAPDLFTDGDYSDVVITQADSSSAVGSIVAIVFALLALLVLLLGGQLFLRSRGIDPLRDCLKKERRKFLFTCSSTSAHQLNCVDAGTSATGNRRQRSLRERANVDGRLNCHAVASATLSSGRVHGGAGGVAPTVRQSADHSISRPVRAIDFSQHVRLMSADSDFRFSEEYEDLKQVGRCQPCTAADLACNRNKNRFTNILPYDHSRVKLISVDDEEGSDYINASYIPGFNSPREFIATQGPLPSTRDDFWRMVVEQNCSAIVNLTRCVEKGREKCDQYWPVDNQPVCYGDVEVVILNEQRFPDWTIRELKITAPERSCSIRHFHFTGWPDFGVPDKPHTLVRFVRAMRLRVPPNVADGGRPIVVHCSAGVGRSGTFIALDRLMQQLHRRRRRRTAVTSSLAKDCAEMKDADLVKRRLNASVKDDAPMTLGDGVDCASTADCDGDTGKDLEDYVDVFGAVHDMRKERVSMVQTEQQYICIHQCLLCVLESKEAADEEMESLPLIFNRHLGSNGLNKGPMAEIHQNPAFEDDEGIAESGL